MFNVGGCSSCHAVPNKDPAEGRSHCGLAAGWRCHRPFGTFYVPNISPDPADGIGNWSEADFVTAMWDGTAPGGYAPLSGVSLSVLSAHGARRRARSVCLSENLAAGAGQAARASIWRFRSTSAACSAAGSFCICTAGRSCPTRRNRRNGIRGAYLVNGPGHCAECHCPRNFLGGIVESERFAGGPSPGRQRLGAEHHAGRPRTLGQRQDRLVGKGYRELPQRRHESGRRFRRRRMAEVIRNTSLLSPDDRAAQWPTTSPRCRRCRGRPRRRRS